MSLSCLYQRGARHAECEVPSAIYEDIIVFPFGNLRLKGAKKMLAR